MVPDIAFLTTGLYPFITTDMIEVQGIFHYCTGWTNGDTGPASTTVPLYGPINFQGNIGKNTDQPDS